MPIPSSVAVKFCNEKIRVAADMLAQLDNFAGAVGVRNTVLQVAVNTVKG